MARKPKRKQQRTTTRQRSREARQHKTHARTVRQQRAATMKARRGGRKRVSFRHTLLWRIVRGTVGGSAKGVVKYAPVVAKAAKKRVDKVRADQKFEADYEPEDGEIPAKRFRARTTYSCCNRRFKTPEALNAHYDREHHGENPVLKPRARPELRISNTARTAGRRTVKPVDIGVTGRHRARNPNMTPAAALIAAHRQKMTEIGVKAVTTDDSASFLIKNGFGQLNDQPITVRQIETDALGLEQAFAAAEDALKAYRLRMHAKGFDSSHTKHLGRMQELAESMAAEAASFIAHVKDELGSAIDEAKKRRAGEGISDEVLAN